jgi:predicted nucleotidyltransferase component of viral defense system
MKPIEQHEQFEIEVLHLLKSHNLLNNLVFGGGTMLRLCYELNRFSVDLDFYFKSFVQGDRTFDQMQKTISKHYNITDVGDKFNTMLIEFKSSHFPMRLKIEINKQTCYPISQQRIAYSRFSNIQVFLDTISLERMMDNKVKALLSRKEIRDAFDIEFLFRQGISLPTNPETKTKMLSVIKSFSIKDFKVKLGSVLPADSREYYNKAGFMVLERQLTLSGSVGIS